MKLQLTSLNYSKIYHVTGDYKLMVDMHMYEDNVARYNISIHNKETNTCCGTMCFNVDYSGDTRKLRGFLPMETDEEIKDLQLDFNFEKFELTIHSDRYYIDDTIPLGLKEEN